MRAAEYCIRTRQLESARGAQLESETQFSSKSGPVGFLIVVGSRFGRAVFSLADTVTTSSTVDID